MVNKASTICKERIQSAQAKEEHKKDPCTFMYCSNYKSLGTVRLGNQTMSRDYLSNKYNLCTFLFQIMYRCPIDLGQNQ